MTLDVFFQFEVQLMLLLYSAKSVNFKTTEMRYVNFVNVKDRAHAIIHLYIPLYVSYCTWRVALKHL